MFNRSDGVQRFHLGGVIEQRTKFSRDPCGVSTSACSHEQQSQPFDTLPVIDPELAHSRPWCAAHEPIRQHATTR
jgi:hypothetical protein